MSLKKQPNILVLGAGMVGSAIALDLAETYPVTAADISASALAPLKGRIKTLRCDLSDRTWLKKLAAKYELVIGAVPGHMGFKTARTVIEAGRPLVDISFFPEDAFLLNRLAEARGVTAIVDCGIAPGFSNMIAGYHHQLMCITSFTCYVGGIPKNPEPPFYYKAPFSPIDVIEEYTRPARLMVDSVEVIKEPLTDVETLYFKNIGHLEAFNTDGLRTLLQTVSIPNMKEKTLRYPGHAEKIQLLRKAGFFSQTPVMVNGKKITPFDMTAALLFPLWKLKPGEPEYTLMRIVLHGHENGQQVEYRYALFDTYDEKTGITSMARTTGYTCTAVARLVAEGIYTQPGISPPEYVGARSICFDYILRYLKTKGIRITRKKKVIKEATPPQTSPGSPYTRSASAAIKPLRTGRK
ncbi:MAG: saccharopine reductase [Chitinophagales bacterium]|nr:MAG: saccharopine reductase [Chitinophagales bacterium]